MILTVTFVHVGRILTRKVEPEWARNRRLTIWLGLALLTLLVGIPWPWSQAARPLFNFG